MNPMRNKEIARTILETLRHAQGFAVPVASLLPQVDGLIRPPVTEDEWEFALAMLSDKSRGAITQIACDFDPTLEQWAITERGRVLLQSL